jgi:hypothetical protein
VGIWSADFDRIGANMRQCSIFHGQRMRRVGYQLCLYPALMLLFVVPSSVSPIDPEMLTPPNNFCSAPAWRNHLSSLEESDWPAVKLVPVSTRLSFADWSVS